MLIFLVFSVSSDRQGAGKNRAPASVLLASTMWYDGEELRQQRCKERRLKLGEQAASSWSRIRFGLMEVMIESRREMRLTYDAVCLGNWLVLSPHPLVLLLARSDSFRPYSYGTSLATYLLTACWPWVSQVHCPGSIRFTSVKKTNIWVEHDNLKAKQQWINK